MDGGHRIGYDSIGAMIDKMCTFQQMLCLCL